MVQSFNNHVSAKFLIDTQAALTMFARQLWEKSKPGRMQIPERQHSYIYIYIYGQQRCIPKMWLGRGTKIRFSKSLGGI